MALRIAISLSLCLSFAGVFSAVREESQMPEDSEQVKAYHVYEKQLGPGATWHLLLGNADALAAALRGEEVAGYKVDYSLNVGDPQRAERKNRYRQPEIEETDAVGVPKTSIDIIRENYPMNDRAMKVDEEEFRDQEQFIEASQDATRPGDTVLLVNCNACVNRSPSVVLYWLVTHENRTLREAYKAIFRSGHRSIDPLPAYRTFLEKKDMALHGDNLSVNTTNQTDWFGLWYSDCVARVQAQHGPEEGEEEDEDEDEDEEENAEEENAISKVAQEAQELRAKSIQLLLDEA